MTKLDLKLGAELLADVLLNATMPEKVIAREKEVQLASIKEDEEQLTTVARNILRGGSFPQHPYALRGKGTVDSVEKLTRKELIDFRDRYLVAKNGVISVFGNVKAAEVKQIFEDSLGAMKPGVMALTDAPAPGPLSKTVTVKEERDKAQGVLMVGYRGTLTCSARTDTHSS